MRKTIVFLLIAMLLFAVSSWARTMPTMSKEDNFSYRENPRTDYRYHDVGNSWLAITNWGFFGNPYADENPYYPSFEYPADSDIDALFQGAVWIGAVVGDEANPDTLVTVGTDGWVAGGGNEMFPGTEPEDMIEVIEHDDRQDFICSYSDIHNVYVPDFSPLGVTVEQTSIAFPNPYLDDFIIVEYTIRNTGGLEPETPGAYEYEGKWYYDLRDVWIGMYTDGDVGPNWNLEYEGVSQDDFSGFSMDDPSTDEYERLFLGWITDGPNNYGGTGDNDFWDIWLGVRVLDVMGANGETIDDIDFSFNWWLSDNNNADLDETPMGDVPKYIRMSNHQDDYHAVADTREVDYESGEGFGSASEGDHYNWPQPTVETAEDMGVTDLPYPGFRLVDPPGTEDTRFLISYGPFAEIGPEEEMQIVVGVIGAVNYPQLLHHAYWSREIYANDYDFEIVPLVQPEEFIVTGWTNDSVDLTWEPFPGSRISYNIYRSEDGETWGEPIANITEDQYTDTGLDEGTEYYYAVTIVREDEESDMSSVQQVLVGQPYIPQNLTIDRASGEIILDWEDNTEEDITGYNIYRNDEFYTNVSSSEYIDTDLEVGEHYTYWVTAVDGYPLESETSNVVSAWAMATGEGVLIVQDEGNTPPNFGDVRQQWLDIVAAAYPGFDPENPDVYLELSDEVTFTRQIASQYEVVIWQSDGFIPNINVSHLDQADVQQVLRDFVEVGGDLWLSGIKVLQKMGGRTVYEAGSFEYDLLGFAERWVRVTPSLTMVGWNGYPDQQLRTGIPPFLIRGDGYIAIEDAPLQEIYSYDDADYSRIGSYYDHDDNAGSVAFTNFPLSAMEFDNAVVCAQLILTEQPQTATAPAMLDFGAVPMPGVSDLILTLSNMGDADLVVDNIYISGPDEADFTIDSGDPQTLAPGASMEIAMTFAPSTEGVKTASLMIESNALTSPDEIALTGTSMGECPDTNEPNNTDEEATELLVDSVEDMVDGCIIPEDIDWFTFNGLENQLIAMYTEQINGSLLNPEIYFYGPDDPTNLLASDDDSYGEMQPHIEISLPADGTYWIRLANAMDDPEMLVEDGKQKSSLRATSGEYRLTVSILPFTRITEGDIVNEAQVALGSAWGDYDDDGDLDLFVATTSGVANLFYANNGDGTFTKITDNGIVDELMPTSNSASWGDYNNDGWLDLFVANDAANIFEQKNFLYHNNGDGTFTKITEGEVVNDLSISNSASWVDYDNDGWLDVFVANGGSDGTDVNFLYHNNGDDTFTKITEGDIVNDAGYSWGCSWGDYDNDGYADLFVANSNDVNLLYHNNGDGTFTKVIDSPVVALLTSSYGGSWGDYDNDGDLDLFVANAGNQNNELYQNNGDGTFMAITECIVVNDGATSLGSGWADYDNDGWLDLLASSNTGTNLLFHNNGDGTFTKVNNGHIVTDEFWAMSLSWGDYNFDGRVDVFFCTGNYENNVLFRRNTNTNNWINIELLGVNTNVSAIGAKVKVKAMIDGEPVWQMREVSGLTGFGGQNSLNVEFGLGDATMIDSMVVMWTDGSMLVETDVDVNEYIQVLEGHGTSVNPNIVTSVPSNYTLHQNYPNPFNPRTNISYELPTATDVTLSIYDISGKLIKRWSLDNQSAGYHEIEWNGTDRHGRTVASGIYLYRLEADDYHQTRRMTLLK